MIYVGRDKFENEELIKYGWPEDIWYSLSFLLFSFFFFFFFFSFPFFFFLFLYLTFNFRFHVDDLSSAHVYVRLQPGQTIGSLPFPFLSSPFFPPLSLLSFSSPYQFIQRISTLMPLKIAPNWSSSDPSKEKRREKSRMSPLFPSLSFLFNPPLTFFFYLEKKNIYFIFPFHLLTNITILFI